MEQPEQVLDSAVANEAAPEPEAQVDEVEIDEELLDEEQQPESDDDDIDDELDGVKVRGKKEAIEKLRNERLMQADYTRKRQAAIAEVEAEKKAIAQQRANVETAGKLYQAHLHTVAELVSIDKQLAAYAQVDWNALTDSDPVQAVKLDRQYRTLQETKNQQLGNLAALQRQHALEEQRKAEEISGFEAKRIEHAAEVLKREVPNWSKRDNELREYAVSQGFDSENLRHLVLAQPQLGKVLDKADRYDRLIAKQKAKAAPTPQAEPVTRIASTRAVANKNPQNMTDAEFAAWRSRQIAQRR